jgi:hypothetical protein
MEVRALGFLILCGFGLAACGPQVGPSAVAIQQPIVTATPPLGAPPGPTQAQSGPTPPAFDRYGNANYDANGTYIGGHGVGTLVDNPDASGMDVPTISMPDMSKMHCTGSSISNAGTMNCSSN